MVEDFASESRFAPSEILAVHGIRSGLEVIIGGAGAPYGILGGYSRRRCTFSPESETLITASIGISIYPIDGMDASRLLKNANTAM
jgi:GGDEF domain-containing protein